MNFDEQNTNYFCFCCQKIILISFSKELHCTTCFDFLQLKEKRWNFAFATVFLTIMFPKFRQKLLFHSVVMSTRKKMSDILLLFALLIVFSMSVKPAFLYWSKLEDLMKFFEWNFTTKLSLLAKWFTYFKSAKTAETSKFENLPRDEWL